MKEKERFHLRAVMNIRSRMVLALIGAAAFSAVGVVAYPTMSSLLFGTVADQVHDELHLVVLRFILLLPIALILLSWLLAGFEKTNLWLHRNRFRLGIAIVVAAVVLNISGSSLGMWNFWLGHDMYQDVVYGTPRAIRSDEYIVNTPLAFAQNYSNYSYFNSNIGSVPSDMFIIKDTPVWTLAEIFRPFHWGYLVLGSSRGLAFYWSARLVVLFLATYELMLLLTRRGASGNKALAVIGASLISFAPLIQWWFAVNGLVEMIIALAIAIVCFDRYCKNHDSWHRAGYALVIAGCAGMYALTLYPAWQIPLAYVLLALAIHVVASNWGSIRMRKNDVIVVAGVTTLFLVLMFSVVVMSFGTISAMLHTVYPGARYETGGGVTLVELLSGIGAVFFPFKEYVGGSNVCEASTFVTLFPLGLVLYVVNAVCRQKIDLTSTILTILIVLFSVSAVVGLPSLLCKITLLSQVPAGRICVALGVLNVLLLAREASSFTEKNHWITIVGIVLLSVCSGVCVHYAYPDWAGTSTVAASAVVYCSVALALCADAQIVRKASAVLAVLILSASGISVNPIQYSVKPITEQPLVKQIQEIDSRQHGTWAVDGDDSSRVAQLLVANGLTTLNAVSVTPRMELWKKLDPDSEYKQVYNRYAFTVILVQGADVKERPLFESDAPDTFTLSPTADDLAVLDVRYVLSSRDLTEYDTDDYVFVPIGTLIDGRTPYEIVEKS